MNGVNVLRPGTACRAVSVSVPLLCLSYLYFAGTVPPSLWRRGRDPFGVKTPRETTLVLPDSVQAVPRPRLDFPQSHDGREGGSPTLWLRVVWCPNPSLWSTGVCSTGGPEPDPRSRSFDLSSVTRRMSPTASHPRVPVLGSCTGADTPSVVRVRPTIDDRKI